MLSVVEKTFSVVEKTFSAIAEMLSAVAETFSAIAENKKADLLIKNRLIEPQNMLREKVYYRLSSSV